MKLIVTILLLSITHISIAQNQNWCEIDENHPLCICERNPGHPQCVTPVELKFFNVRLENNIPTLTWVTNTESNNNYFVIHKSYDGFEWKEVANITGNGTTKEENSYKWYDYEDVLNRIVYYKLSQVDYDLTTKQIGLKGLVLDFILIEGHPIYGEIIEIKYFDLNGREVDSKKEGVKILRIVTTKGIFVIKIV